MSKVINEKLADEIAINFMTKMNPDGWNGVHEQPDTVDTSEYIDDNKITINKSEYNLKIQIDTDTNNTYSNRPNLKVVLVSDDDEEQTGHYLTTTLSSTALLSKMIQRLCNDFAA